MLAKHPVMHVNIPLSAGHNRPRRMLAPLLACAIAAFLHLLIWLALPNDQPPQATRIPPQNPRLTVRLIAPTFAAAKPATAKVPSHLASPKSRASSARQPLREARVARRPEPQQPPPRPAQEIDWHADLNALTAPRAPFPGNTLGAAAASSATATRPKHTAEATLTREMAKAARSDCRNAYANMGLLAAPMLAVDAIRRSGCKW